DIEVESCRRDRPVALTIEIQADPGCVKVAAESHGFQAIANRSHGCQQSVATQLAARAGRLDRRVAPRFLRRSVREGRQRCLDEPCLASAVHLTETPQAPMDDRHAGFTEKVGNNFPAACPEVTRTGSGREYGDVAAQQIL